MSLCPNNNSLMGQYFNIPLLIEFNPKLPMYVLLKFTYSQQQLYWLNTDSISLIDSAIRFLFSPYSDEVFTCFNLLRPVKLFNKALAPLGDMCTLTIESFYKTLKELIFSANILTPASPNGFLSSIMTRTLQKKIIEVVYAMVLFLDNRKLQIHLMELRLKSEAIVLI